MGEARQGRKFLSSLQLNLISYHISKHAIVKTKTAISKLLAQENEPYLLGSKCKLLFLQEVYNFSKEEQSLSKTINKNAFHEN